MHHSIEEYIDIDPNELRHIIEEIERDIFRNAREQSERVGRHITPEEYDMEVMSLLKIVKHLPVDLHSLDKFLEKREKAFEELKLQVYGLEEEKEALETDNLELRKKIEEIRNKPSEELKKENRRLREENERLVNQNDELEEKNNQLEEQFEPLNDMINSYNKIIKRSKINFEAVLSLTDKIIEDLNGLPDGIKPIDTKP